MEGGKEERRVGGKGEQVGRERGSLEESQLYWTDRRQNRLEDPPQSPGSLLSESDLVLFTERFKSKKAVKSSGADTS